MSVRKRQVKYTYTYKKQECLGHEHYFIRNLGNIKITDNTINLIKNAEIEIIYFEEALNDDGLYKLCPPLLNISRTPCSTLSIRIMECFNSYIPTNDADKIIYDKLKTAFTTINLWETKYNKIKPKNVITTIDLKLLNYN